MSATSPAPTAPARPNLTPPRPRLVADLGVAALAFIALGLPSVLLAPQPWHVEFFLFGTQNLLSADSPGTAATVIRTVINLAAAVGMPVAVIWRASKPVHSTAVVAALALAHFFTGVILMPVDFLIFLSLYSLTIYASSAASRIGLFTALFGGFLVTISIAPIWGGLESALVGSVLFLLAAMLVLLSWGAGLLRRSRLEQRESLRERALRLERERDQQAQIATVAERNRIAREMHDIVAHSLSVVVAQADGGRYAAAADPQAATRALETIAETSRAALADMRRILGVLRDENGETADLIPQPADADIDALISQVKAAGLNVSHVTLGAARALPPGAGVALYRIVQESLTNILKHGGPEAAAIVTTEWKSDGLTVSIDDDGRGAAARSDGAGHGLVGMRERAAMLGGSLAAGPKPGGGFRVRFHIPLPNSGPGLQ